MSASRSGLFPVIDFLLLLLILVLWSLLPEPLKGYVATFGLLHRVTHIAAFCIGFMVAASGLKRPWAPLILAILLAGFGVALEFLQSAVYGNYPEYWDMRDDAWGVALGWLCQRLAAATKRHISVPDQNPSGAIR